MSSTTATALSGTYVADPVHSSFGFAVRYQGVSLFRGTLDDVTASLTDGRLEGAAKVESISIRTPEQFRAHVLSAEFFDAENHPEVTFTSDDVELARGRHRHGRGRADDQGHHEARPRHRHLDRPGRRRVRQHPRPPAARGRDRPHRVGHELEHGRCPPAARCSPTTSRSPSTSRSSSRPSPMRILGIAGSLRRGSHNRRLLRAAGDALPPGVVLEEWEGLAGLPGLRRRPRGRAAGARARRSVSWSTARTRC